MCVSHFGTANALTPFAHNIPRLPAIDAGLLTWLGRPPYLLSHPRRTIVNSGRAAIAMAIRSLRIGAGESVLVPTLHCPSMISPIIEVGALPKFYPVDSTGTPRLDWLEDQDLSSSRLICVAHYFGIPQGMRRIRTFVDRCGIHLLEDCAHALFGDVDGKPIGSWGDFAVGSLVKFLPSSDGGVLVTNRGFPQLDAPPARTLFDEIRAFADVLEIGARHKKLGWMNPAIHFVALLKRALRRSARNESNVAIEEGSEMDLGPVLAGTRVTKWLIAHSNFQKMAQIRRENYKILANRLQGVSGARVMLAELSESVVPYVFPLWVDAADQVHNALKTTGVPVMRWNRPWAQTPRIAGDMGIDLGHHVLQLPCHQSLSSDQVEWLGDTIAAAVTLQ